MTFFGFIGVSIATVIINVTLVSMFSVFIDFYLAVGLSGYVIGMIFSLIFILKEKEEEKGE